MSYGNIYSLIVSNFESDTNKVANISQKLLQAAGTIASGTGDDIQTVLDNIRSAINGSSESVDQYGLSLKVANLAAAAGVKDWNKLTTQQQQAVIVQQILNQTAAKYGGIVDSAASRQAMFNAQLANTKLAMGNLGSVIFQAIMPALTKLLVILETVFNYATKVVAAVMGIFGMKASFGGTSNTGDKQPTGGGITKTPTVKNDTTEDATDKNDKLSDSYDKVGDSAKKSAKDVKDSAKTMKGSLAGLRLVS